MSRHVSATLLWPLVLVWTAVGCGGGGGGGATPGAPAPPPSPPPAAKLVPEDVIALHDQDLAKAGLSCQAPDCHRNQMERYAPHVDASGNLVENFHYMKAKSLSESFFEGRPPEQFQDRDCTVCHKRVRLLAYSGADATGYSTYLRQSVNVAFCARCHTLGPGKGLYLLRRWSTP